MGNVFNITQFNGFVCKKSQSPFGIAFRRSSAGECNDPGFNITCYFCRYRGCFPFFSGKRCCKSFSERLN